MFWKTEKKGPYGKKQILRKLREMIEYKNKNHEYISGINSVCSLVTKNAGRRKIYRVIINSYRKKDSRIHNIITGLKRKNIEIKELSPEEFYDISDGAAGTQGILAVVSPYNYAELDDYLSSGEDGRIPPWKSKGRLVILDGVTDVGNFGSIIRNCSAFGFEGIIVSKRRSVALNERVSKISAGALEKVKVFRVVNIVRTIKKLKDTGFWIYGTTLDINPEVKYLEEVNFTFPMALVLGSEDKGMSRLVSNNCDIMITIKLSGGIQSLNVSVASGIILHKVQEQIEKV